MIRQVMKNKEYQTPAPRNRAVMVVDDGKTLYIVRHIHTGNHALKDTVGDFLRRRVENGG